GAYDVMASKHIRGDLNFAWPTAEIAVMGSEGAVNIVFRKEIAEASDPAARRKELVEQYETNFSNPFKAAELGFVDEVIQFEDTRRRIVDGLALLRTKQIANPPKKHGNIPL
ncbi:MAG: carboxyl transferase domain-containing protein, partial [bacterium]